MTTEMQQAPKIILEYCNICCDLSRKKVEMYSLDKLDKYEEDFLYQCSICSEQFWIGKNEATRNEVE